MLKKSIKYTDYNGVERVEDFYFNLSKAEVAEMELSVDGGMSAMLEKIVETNNNKASKIKANIFFLFTIFPRFL